MGAGNSKDGELPKFPFRGSMNAAPRNNCRNDSKACLPRVGLSKSEQMTSCVTLLEDQKHEASLASLMILRGNENGEKRVAPRLQSIGVKRKSYVDQLIALRSKSNGISVEPPVLAVKTPAVVNIASQVVKTRGEVEVQVPPVEKTLEQRPIPAYKDDEDASSDDSMSTSSAPECRTYRLEVASMEGNLSGPEGLEQIRSDMTVVPYDQAKARFENGNHRKRPKKNEAYLQLEELGLGFWNEDQWVPTKVVTLALSDQLSCAGADWPSSYRYRSNYSCQGFRTAYSEMQY